MSANRYQFFTEKWFEFRGKKFGPKTIKKIKWQLNDLLLHKFRVASDPIHHVNRLLMLISKPARNIDQVIRD